MLRYADSKNLNRVFSTSPSIHQGFTNVAGTNHAILLSHQTANPLLKTSTDSMEERGGGDWDLG